MTAAERKKLEEEAIKRQKSTSPASSFRKKMEGEALKKQKELAARKVGTDYPVTLADERTEAPTSIIGRINADIAKGREAEQTKRTLVQREKAEQDKAVRQSNAPKLSDINRSAAPVDYTKESAEAKNRFTAENPTLGMSPPKKLEYNARKYNPLALGDMAINQAAAGAGRFAASVSDAVIAPFKGKGIVYPALQTTQELWNTDKGKEPSALDKYIGNVKATLRTFKNAGRGYYLGGGTLQDKADKYSLEMSERYAEITDNAVTRAMSDLAQSAGYMIPAQLANAIIPNAGTALLFVSGYSSGERQALQEGASPQDARNYALLNGLNQSAGEMLIGGVLGQGAGVLDGLLKKAGLDVASKITDPKLLRLAKGLTSALGEGAEEVIQGLIDVQAKRMTYDKGAKADPAGLAYEGLLGSLLGAGSSASAAILNAQNDTMSLPSPLPITEQKNAANTPSIDADISAKQAELSARLKTADEEALYRRLTAAKTDTEKSGILAGASDEAVAAAVRFADKGGLEIAFIRENAVNGVVKDGFTKGGKIYINAASDKTAATIITHELLHNLEQTDGYAAFKDYIGKHVNLTADAEELTSLYRRGGLELTPMEIESEALAKYAEKLFESEDDIYNLVRTDRTLGQKILDWINSMITKLTGTAEEKYLLKAKELYSKALAEARSDTVRADTVMASVSADVTGDNFKRWFGDSKVKNEDGSPKIVYHGTNVDENFTMFDTYGSKYGLYGMGSYFTEDKDIAWKYTKKGRGGNPRVYEAYLNIRNPLDMDAPADITAWEKAISEDDYIGVDFSGAKTNSDAMRLIEQELEYNDYTAWEGAEFITDTIRSMGYDGITHIGGNIKGDKEHRVWIAYEPEQIKSATDNVGTYDPGNADIRYSISKADDTAYMTAVNSGDMETAQKMVDDAAQKSGLTILDDSASTSYRVRRTPPPEKTVKAYKLFATKKSRPGELFPLFVGADTSVPQDVWLDAIAGQAAPDSKTGRQKVKSKLGPLAYRPGWHAGDIPLATHIGAKDANGNIWARQDHEVWAEVEVAADTDYQPEADANGKKKDGSFSVALADIKHMPENGMYRYKTNPNMTGNWIISGSMKINRVLTESEVNGILTRQGKEPMPWKSGKLDLSTLGLSADEAKNKLKILDPVTYDDNGNIIPLSQRFNPKSSDIRYSVTEDTGAKTIKALEKENKALRELNDYQRKQFKRSDRKEADPKAVAKYIKGLLKSYSSKTSFDDIQKKLADLYIYIANGDENGAPGWETAYEQARDIADDILQGSEVLLNGDMLETYSDIKNYFRRKKFYVPAESKTELVDYNNFRNKNFGKFILTTNPAGGGYSVDASYAEMTELFGEGYFPSEITNPTDQLQHISHVLEGMKAIYGNPFSGQAFDEVTAIVSSDILDKFYDIPQRQPTFADKAAKEVTLAKVKGQAKLDALRERKNAQIDKIRQDLRETAAKKMRDLRQNNDDKIAKLKADIRERAVKARVNRSKTALRVRIRKSCRQMIKMLAKPDKNRHIPDGLQESVAELFDLIASSPDEIVQTGDMAGTPKTDALKGRLAKVSDLYRRILSENNAPVTLDPDLQVMFDQAKDDLANAPWNKLGAEQLDNLYRLTRAIYKSITTANKAFRDAQNRTYDDLAEAVRVDNAGKNDRAPFSGSTLIRGAKKVADDLINFSVIDPRRFFKRLGKTMETLYLNIEHGQDKYIDTVTRTVGFMKKTLDGIDTTKWDGDGADRIKVGIIIDEFAGTTQEVEFTPAMLIDLYLANKREQSRKHLYGIGGIALQLPGADKPAKPIKITEQQINDILNKHMTADMTRVANAMSEYLTKDMGALANEVSQEMYGYSKFTEQAYWPIDVHRGSVTKSFGEVKGDPTLENSGATKTLVEKAKNALVIKSALDVFDKHTIWAAAYNAYVPALADMRHVLNSKDLDGTTIASLLNEKFGEKAEKYINNFMNLVNSGKLSHGLWNDKISKKLLRNFKAASVGLNASVVVKQPVSYIRAADEINPKYLLQALKLESRKARRANMAEMLKYNPIARIKDWGFADMGFGKNQRQLYDKSSLGLSDKISEVSGFLPSQADKVTWARIWQAVKLEQQAKGINDVGRWTERFREVISSTQVVNTIFTTPPILNEDSTLTSMATAFMAEPLKSFNMLHDAISSKNAAQIRRTAAALVTNTFAIAIIDTAFKHLRQKEDEEETTVFSLAGEVLLNMLEDTLSMLPYARDMISIFQGYDVERADLTGIDKLWKALASTGNDIVAAVSGGEPRGTAILRLKDVVAGLSVVTGIPAGNIWRDVESILRSYAQYTTNAGLEYLFTATLYNPENDSNRRYYYDLLYRYRDDDKAYEALKKQLIKEHGYRVDNIESAILSRWKQSGEYKSAYEAEAARVIPSVEGNPRILELPKAERESLAEQADAYAAAVARDRLDSDYELNASTIKIKSAVEDGLSVGEYLLYTNARKKADEALDDNGSYGIKEKARAIRELSWMSESKRAALLALDTGKSNEIEALADAGLPLDEFINIYERHAEIGAEEDLSASQQALKYANWLDGRYTAEQADIIQEYFGYWSGAKAVPTYYNNFTDAGMDIDTAYDLADAISKLKPVEGKKSVSARQRYRVVADAEMSDKDKLRAMSALMPEAGYKALRKAKLQGLKIDSYVKYLEGTAGIVSDVKNGEPISGSRKQKVLTYINRMLIPRSHKDLLYYIAGYSENTISDAPWHGGTPYSGNINGKKVNGRVLRPLKSKGGA